MLPATRVAHIAGMASILVLGIATIALMLIVMIILLSVPIFKMGKILTLELSLQLEFTIAQCVGVN